ncbi:exodeoxyribonuclease III [Candidatus Saccharibacteria bacterium]|nr:exodeoxyribonuclease III [Candidatus Saccharibacteria bacterium]
MKIVSWNVNGVRAILKKGALQEFVAQYQPDILCLQETKAKQGQAEVDFEEYEEIWNSAERAGYSGTAIFTKKEPEAVFFGFPEGGEFEGYGWEDKFGDARKEGRILTAEFDEFFLVNVYVPNEKDDLGRLKYREKVWDRALLAHLKKLDEQKPVIVCGDFNVAHEEIDLARPEQNRGHAGFTDEGRQGMTNYLRNGFRDVWRETNPGVRKYTWWSYRGGARQRGVGWRIDYFLASESLMTGERTMRVVGAEILDEVMGSDHCPIMVELQGEE